MPKNWKYIKKLLEKEFLCEKLRGHITYDLTEYKPAPWDQQHFILKCNQDVLLEAQMSIYNGSGRYNLKINPYKIGVMLSHQLHQKLNIENHTCYQDDIDIASYECAKKCLSTLRTMMEFMV